MKLTTIEENSLALLKFSKNLLYQLNPIHQLKMRDEFLQKYSEYTLNNTITNSFLPDETIDLFPIYDAITRRG